MMFSLERALIGFAARVGDSVSRRPAMHVVGSLVAFGVLAVGILLVEVESDVFKLWVRFEIFFCVFDKCIPFRLVSSNNNNNNNNTSVCFSERNNAAGASSDHERSEKRERERAMKRCCARRWAVRSHFFLFFVVLPPTLFFFADGADDARCNSNLLWEMEEEQKRVYGV